MQRRTFIASTAALALSGPAAAKGLLKQSVCRGPYRKLPLPDFCKLVKAAGLSAIDLLEPKDWGLVRDQGIVCSMGYGGGNTREDALNIAEMHDEVVRRIEKNAPLAAKAGVPNLIAIFGFRKPGLSDEASADNCIAVLNRIKPIVEAARVNLCVELLNSKVDHPGYVGDRTAFGAKVVRAVGSPRVKLVYDIYHMQIMEGDVIRTLREHKDLIAHYHTGGNPGRNEIDETQELHYPAICRAIVDTGFTGYLAHEFTPKGDPLISLRKAVALCDV